MNTKQAIEQVLKGKRNPMRVPEIIAAGVPLATELKGKTPGQTFYSVLYAESKKADGLVVQTGKGEFKLNPKRKAAKPKADAKVEA
jgi:HB1, ASXL, restriction endonuclease HTH domain